MAFLIAFPILGVLLILQSAVVSRISLLHGTADLILLTVIAWALHARVKTAWHWAGVASLMVLFVSAAPVSVSMLGYPLVVALALLLRKRIWQAPVLAMLICTFFGTLMMHALTLVGMRLLGTPFSFLEALNVITLPSILLNLLLAIPAYALTHDLANWVYPEELSV